MAASLKQIRKQMKVAPTARDKGLTLTLEVRAYDNGMIAVDGVPLNDQADYDSATGWLTATEVIVQTLNEFRRQASVRVEQRSSGHES